MSQIRGRDHPPIFQPQPPVQSRLARSYSSNATRLRKRGVILFEGTATWLDLSEFGGFCLWIFVWDCFCCITRFICSTVTASSYHLLVTGGFSSDVADPVGSARTYEDFRCAFSCPSGSLATHLSSQRAVARGWTASTTGSLTKLPSLTMRLACTDCPPLCSHV
eukprot:5730845-Heterocapsa_arctica.AAC.1